MRLTPSIFLILDISGYTPFVRLHKLNLLHAEKVITDLLEAIIDVSQPPLKLNKLEGDAVFFYAEQRDNPAATAENVMRQAQVIMDAFVVKASQLDGANICICDACKVVTDLKLKGFLHAGDAAIKSVARHEELASEDVILAHKLMKNDIPSSEYLAVTSAFEALTDTRPPWTSDSRTVTIEEFGDTTLKVYYFGAEQVARAVEHASKGTQGMGAKLGRIGELILFTLPRLFRFSR